MNQINLKTRLLVPALALMLLAILVVAGCERSRQIANDAGEAAQETAREATESAREAAEAAGDVAQETAEAAGAALDELSASTADLAEGAAETAADAVVSAVAVAGEAAEAVGAAVEVAGDVASETVQKASGAIEQRGTGDSSYTVRTGDSLTKIALAEYGDASLWSRIADANGISDPHLIHPGQILSLPRS